MPAMILLIGWVVVGCATQPTSPAPNIVVAKTPPAAVPGTPADIEAQRLAAARNLNMKVIDKAGRQLFCRSNLVTGSHIQRDVTCYTADQLDHMQAQMQPNLDRLTVTPSQNQGLPAP
jgi:hypothetical protein